MSARPSLMGILNVTPDSFSERRGEVGADAAVERGVALAADGADILDVGGESTRPGAQPVAQEEELRRVMPVIEGLVAAGVAVEISIDTYKAEVARAALEAGASLVNDVSALRMDAGMAHVVASAGARCCLVHMRGEPRTMHREVRYDDVVGEVKAFLAERIEFAVGAGIARERILIDPGIGFGKDERHNLELLARLGELRELGAPIVIGTSRKSFLGRIVARARGEREPVAVHERLEATVASNVIAYMHGARVFRVHDVAAVRDALAVAAATFGERWTASGATATRAI